MEKATSSSRAQASPTENESEATNSASSHQFVLSASSGVCHGHDSSSSSTTLDQEAVEDSSSPSISSQDNQKTTNADSLVTSDMKSLSNEASKELTNDRMNSSSPDKTISIEEIWSSDCEYSDSLREFREAFNCAVGTVLDIVKNRICWLCSNPNNTGARDLEELLRPLPPLVAPALKDAALLLAAQKGEGHALVHLLALGARGDGTDCDRRNALHLACMGGWSNCVYILLDLKAISGTKGRARSSSWDPKTNFEAVDVHSKTPLDYAKEKAPESSCAYYIERAIELQYDKRVRKVKKKP